MTGATSGSSLLQRKELKMAGATSGSSILRNQERNLGQSQVKKTVKSKKRPKQKN